MFKSLVPPRKEYSPFARIAFLVFILAAAFRHTTPSLSPYAEEAAKQLHTYLVLFVPITMALVLPITLWPRQYSWWRFLLWGIFVATIFCLVTGVWIFLFGNVLEGNLEPLLQPSYYFEIFWLFLPFLAVVMLGPLIQNVFNWRPKTALAGAVIFAIGVIAMAGMIQEFKQRMLTIEATAQCRRVSPVDGSSPVSLNEPFMCYSQPLIPAGIVGEKWCDTTRRLSQIVQFFPHPPQTQRYFYQCHDLARLRVPAY